MENVFADRLAAVRGRVDEAARAAGRDPAEVTVLRIGREKVSDKGIRSANKRVDPVRSQTHLPRSEVVAMLKAHFEGRYRTRRSDLTSAELARAVDLVTTKFATPTWTARVP